MFSKQEFKIRYYLKASSPDLLLTQDVVFSNIIWFVFLSFAPQLRPYLVIIHRDNIYCLNLWHENII